MEELVRAAHPTMEFLCCEGNSGSRRDHVLQPLPPLRNCSQWARAAPIEHRTDLLWTRALGQVDSGHCGDCLSYSARTVNPALGKYALAFVLGRDRRGDGGYSD